MKNQLKAQFSILLFSLTFAIGCGDLRSLDGDYAPQGAYPSTSSANTNNSSDPDYTCPESPNVVPEYDWNFNGTDHFTVCANNNSIYTVAVYGMPSKSTSICFFPVQSYDKNNNWLKPDSFFQPMVQCTDTTFVDGTRVAHFTFDKTSFNAAYIVMNEDKNQMISCLKTKNLDDCPHFSFGNFR